MKKLILALLVLVVGCAGGQVTPTPIEQVTINIVSQQACYFAAKEAPTEAVQLSAAAQAIIYASQSGSTVDVLGVAFEALINTYIASLPALQNDPLLVPDLQLLIQAFMPASTPVIMLTPTVFSQAAQACISGVTAAGTAVKMQKKRGIIR